MFCNQTGTNNKYTHSHRIGTPIFGNHHVNQCTSTNNKCLKTNCYGKSVSRTQNSHGKTYHHELRVPTKKT